jgi:hypothetical protein
MMLLDPSDEIREVVADGSHRLSRHDAIESRGMGPVNVADSAVNVCGT